MKILKKEINYQDEVINTTKKDLDFLCDEFQYFLDFRGDAPLTEADRKHVNMLYEELLLLSQELDSFLRKYLKMRLNRIERKYKEFLT